MSTLYITRGLPASGKTTWARQFLKASPEVVDVNRDNIRELVTVGDAKWNKQREKTTVVIRDAMIRAALNSGLDAISSDTNLAPSVVKDLQRIARECKAECVINDEFLKVTPQECIKRDLMRSRSVGASVIWKMYRDYIKPEPIVQDEKLPHAILVDMDGTLAHIGDRSPYAGHECEVDTLNGPVADVVRSYLTANPNVYLIIMSGRDEGARAATGRFLASHNFVPDHMFMRALDDTRHDNIVKRELFDANVRDQFHVDMVFDDRDQVVQMWRDELGLPCMQVFWGDF